MTFRTVFSDFAPSSLPAIPSNWTDSSWINNACPSFDCGNLTVFVDYEHPNQRECTDICGARYSVHNNASDFTDVVFESDDWDAVLEFVATFRT